MFPPETPPPSKFRRAKPAPVKKESNKLFVRTVQVLFIVLGISIIVAIIAQNPKGKHLICDRTTMRRNSLTSFGSCRAQ
ncbi:MAG: hypothetical protein PHW76_01305 [Alphaproteobacteria bacterium]|nr:hypothetical protein [Alphaproteobacteria bacterium]